MIFQTNHTLTLHYSLTHLLFSLHSPSSNLIQAKLGFHQWNNLLSYSRFLSLFHFCLFHSSFCIFSLNSFTVSQQNPLYNFNACNPPLISVNVQCFPCFMPKGGQKQTKHSIIFCFWNCVHSCESTFFCYVILVIYINFKGMFFHDGIFRLSYGIRIY